MVGRKRQISCGCTLTRLLIFALLLIVIQVTIVLHQIVIWSRMKCVNPIKCSKVVFFDNFMGNSRQRLFSVHEIDSSSQNNITAAIPVINEEDDARTCGISGRGKDMGLIRAVNLHLWYGWCGYTTDDLRRDPKFPRTPKMRTAVNELKVERTKYKRYSGKRMFGYIHPPKTGFYQFFISSEDSSDLWLSLDDEPVNTKMIAYIGEASNQYGGSSKQGDYSKKSQRSENISLVEGKAYFFDVYQKKKGQNDHLQVAWRVPDSNEIHVIGSRYLSQYFAESSPDISKKRQDCVMRNVPGLDMRYKKYIEVQKPDLIDEFFIHAKVLDDPGVDRVLKVCPYTPTYLTKPIKKQFDSQLIILHNAVYPNDSTALFKEDNGEISEGNKVIPEKEAKDVVSSYMNSLKAETGNTYQLNRIALLETKYDSEGGARYLMELDVKKQENGKSVRLSRYLYSSSRRNATQLCYPKGYVWKRTTPIFMIVTVMNYGVWIKDLISQLSKFYKDGVDRNFYLTIIDFNSTDTNLKDVIGNSDLRERCTIIKKSVPFWKTHGLNEGAALVKDPESIIFTMDLHLKLPASIFDAIRKHTIEGKTVFTPKLVKLKCGFSPRYSQGGWDIFGYGLFAAYKSDWDRIGGMDENQFRHKWGGEDVDLMDRVLKAKLDVERVCLPKLYHFFHRRDQDWYEDARL